MEKALVIGGTRFFGVHLVKSLLDMGVHVTVATRGTAADPLETKWNEFSLTALI